MSNSEKLILVPKIQDFKGIIVFSSLTIVLLLLAITIRNKPENVAWRKELKEAENERNQEAKDIYIKNSMADPYLNTITKDFFEVHNERLKEHRVSILWGYILFR